MLLQRLVWADRDAIAPATNLLHREPMRGGRFPHLNVKLGSWRDRVGPTIAFQRCDAKSCGLVDDSAVTSTECRTPDGPVKLTVHVRSATAGQRIIFALSSPVVISDGWGALFSFLVRNAVLGWLSGRLPAVGKSETELAIDVQLASRAASRRFERADE
jgi:hypothetical protein